MPMDAGEIERMIREALPDAHRRDPRPRGRRRPLRRHRPVGRLQGQDPGRAAPDGLRRAPGPDGRRAPRPCADHGRPAGLSPLAGVLPMDRPSLYDDDIVTWAEEQAAALRALAARGDLSNASIGRTSPRRSRAWAGRASAGGRGPADPDARSSPETRLRTACAGKLALAGGDRDIPDHGLECVRSVDAAADQLARDLEIRGTAADAGLECSMGTSFFRALPDSCPSCPRIS